MTEQIVTPKPADGQPARDWNNNLGWNSIKPGDKVWHSGWDQLLLVKRVNKRKYGISLSIEAIGPGDGTRVGDREIIDNGLLFKPTQAELSTEISLDKYNDCPKCKKGHLEYKVAGFAKRLPKGKGRCDVCGYEGLPEDVIAPTPDTRTAFAASVDAMVDAISDGARIVDAPVAHEPQPFQITKLEFLLKSAWVAKARTARQVQEAWDADNLAQERIDSLLRDLDNARKAVSR